jgi:hypothetical protein
MTDMLKAADAILSLSALMNDSKMLNHLGHPFAFGYFMQARRRPSFAVMR